MYGGSLDLKTPVLFAVGDIFLCTVGRRTGVVLADTGIDLAVLWRALHSSICMLMPWILASMTPKLAVMRCWL